MCFSRICCCCVCIVLVVIAIGFTVGFGVFQHGFDKLKSSMHMCESFGTNGTVTTFCGRPFLPAPPPR
ncbi:uncharacterized protein LOC127254206 [Andrographis paniculata]|uniref:uncharacterized protein LOC127254206 n=1 Tax=Andrographis paniculata TaxID=175694 RepID=UPI0021E91821|nr:uncharacterized protein LOC127254206 [Andrographis paniculata]XP_051135134.1 uncharacterized protein LOC127254206 [Andrographis paniculata]